MSCCDNETTSQEHEKAHVGQCDKCGCDIDEDGMTIELDHCSYSPQDCSICGYQPCDHSC